MAFCNMDFAFEFLKLEYLYGHIMANNKRAIRFNKALGYLLDDNQNNREKQKYKLTKERYFEQKSKIIGLFR
jgi:RimJ/RimL family protein N-acetyltransferase